MQVTSKEVLGTHRRRQDLRTISKGLSFSPGLKTLMHLHSWSVSNMTKQSNFLVSWEDVMPFANMLSSSLYPRRKWIVGLGSTTPSSTLFGLPLTIGGQPSNFNFLGISQNVSLIMQGECPMCLNISTCSQLRTL